MIRHLTENSLKGEVIKHIHFSINQEENVIITQNKGVLIFTSSFDNMYVYPKVMWEKSILNNNLIREILKNGSIFEEDIEEYEHSLLKKHMETGKMLGIKRSDADRNRYLELKKRFEDVHIDFEF